MISFLLVKQNLLELLETFKSICCILVRFRLYMTKNDKVMNKTKEFRNIYVLISIVTMLEEPYHFFPAI